MLFDGVKVDYRWKAIEVSEDSEGNEEEKDEVKKDGPKYHSATVVLRLALAPGDSLSNAILKFVTRSRVTSMDRDVENRFHSSLELRMKSIVSISQSVTNKSFRHLMSAQDKNERRKRFVCLEIDDGEKIVFLARTGKDASLLSCGLKLVTEKILEEKRQNLI